MMQAQDFKTDLLAAVMALMEEYGTSAVVSPNLYGNKIYIQDVDIKVVFDDDDGDGNTATVVLEFRVNYEIVGYVRVTGTYSSWDDTTWHKEETRVVQPRQTCVTAWVAADGSEDHRHVFI